MATGDSISETIDQTNISTTPRNKTKRGKLGLYPVDSEGGIENTNGTVSINSPSKHLRSKKTDDKTNSETHEETRSIDEKQVSSLKQTLTPIYSSSKTPENPSKIEIETVTDEDDKEEPERQQRMERQPAKQIITKENDLSTSITNSTNFGNHELDFHELTSGDVDAYISIYFETLDNRLRHFFGDDVSLQQFRVAMKNRICSEPGAREYHNVVLGKINNEVVAAALLSFPSERATIVEDDLVGQTNSCLASMRRWMLRNANYIPKNMEECYIEMIGVKSENRNQGIGTSMLEYIEQFAQQNGAVLLTIHCNHDQSNYFQHFGFVVDNADKSALWKWIVERQNTVKMTKTLSPKSENNDFVKDYASSFNNESELE